jgi:CHAT domain-containing protein/tetratricopeptide (TPR) repeat protein
MEAYRSNQYDEALHPFLEGLKKIKTSDDKWYTLLSGMAVLCHCQLGNYLQAIELQEEVAIKICKQYGNKSYQYAKELEKLGTIYWSMGNLNKAIENGEQSLTIYIAKGDSISTEFASTSMMLTSAYLANDNPMKALYHCKKATTIAEVQGETTLYLTGLNNMSVICENLNDYDNAILYAEECLKKLSSKKEENIISYATTLSNLGLDYIYNGQIIKGKTCIEEALTIMKDVYGDKHVKYATLLTNLGYAYTKYGDYDHAIKIEEKAYAIYKNSPIEKNYHGIMSTLNNLISYCYHEGKQSEAKLYEKEYRERALGDSTLAYAMFLHNIASYESSHQKAISIEEEALEIAKKHNSMILVANIMEGIAKHYYEDNGYEEALLHSLFARQIFVDVVGDNHQDYYYSLHNLSSFYWKLNDYKKAAECYMELISKVSAHILSFFPSLSLNQQKEFWSLYNKMYEENLHKHTFYNIDYSDYIQLAYNGILLSKGLLLNTEIEMKKILYEQGDQSVISLYNEIKTDRSIFNKVSSLPLSKRNINLDSLNQCIEVKEKLLINKSKQFGDYTENLKIKWQDVQAKLGQKDMSIEFVSFPLANDSTMYVAYVLKKGMTSPKMIPLFEEKQLKKGEELYKNTSVSKLVWEPLAEYLNGVQNVYFAPAGELYNIGIEYLPHWSGEGRMSEKWKMYRLSSTRQLAVIKDKNALKLASVYGGVKYDTKEELLITDSRKYHSQERSFSYEPFAIADSLNLRAGASYLPATKTEAEEIDKTLEQKKIMTKLLIDTLATEGAFKDLSGKKTNLLHIATHGFYWTEKEAQYSKNLDFLMLGENQPKYVEDKALTRSGLLMAGANNALMGKKLPEGVDDGILTAKEISQLDLRGLDLVVLSACETGLGEIKGDGVFGLQRGFKKAGANSLLMSLWKVDDNATQLLMTRFYKNLTSGMSKFESLRQAQKYVREYEVEIEVKSDNRPSVSAHAREQAQQNVNKEKVFKKVKKYEDPKYWAAFILLDAID